MMEPRTFIQSKGQGLDGIDAAAQLEELGKKAKKKAILALAEEVFRLKNPQPAGQGLDQN